MHAVGALDHLHTLLFDTLTVVCAVNYISMRELRSISSEIQFHRIHWKCDKLRRTNGKIGEIS